MTRRTLHPETDLFYRSSDTTVYLIHFDRKISHAQHYIGSTNDLDRRLQEHQHKWPRYKLTRHDLDVLRQCLRDMEIDRLQAMEGRLFRRKHTFVAALEKQLCCRLAEADKRILFRQARKHMTNGLVMSANQRHIPWRLAMTWPANRDFEMFLKRGKHAQRLCPICCGEGEDALPGYLPF